MRFDPTEEYDTSRIVLSIEDKIDGFEFEAFCSPESVGLTYAGGQPIQNDDGEGFGAPFQVDIVLDEGTVISQTEDRKIREELGPRFAEQIQEGADEAYEKIKDSDDPVQTILNMEAEELV